MEEEDYGLAPAPASRPQFKDEPNIAGQLAMEHARDAIAHDRKFSAGGGKATFGEALSEGWMFLGIQLGAFLVLAVIGIFLGGGPRGAAGGYFLVCGGISMIAGRLWIIWVAAQKGEVAAAILCFLCGLFALIYAILNFGECKYGLAFCLGSYLFYGLIGATM
jgi:hypothetical protein